MKKKILFKGCGTAICTPFDKDGVNLKVLISSSDFEERSIIFLFKIS